MSKKTTKQLVFIIVPILVVAMAYFIFINIPNQKPSENNNSQLTNEGKPTSIEEKENTEGKWYINSTEVLEKFLSEVFNSTELVRIPNTNLELEIPKAFVKETAVVDVFTNLYPTIYYNFSNLPEEVQEASNCYQKYNVDSGSEKNILFGTKPTGNCKTLLDKYQDIYVLNTFGQNNFFIYQVEGYSKAENWLRENISFQGKKWDESINDGGYITINNRKLYSVGVGCCGGNETLYILEYLNPTSNKASLIMFGTNSGFGDQIDEKNPNLRKNLILDSFVSKLKLTERENI